jgi:hypothetical protein
MVHLVFSNPGLISETMNLLDILWDTLDGRSAHRKPPPPQPTHAEHRKITKTRVELGRKAPVFEWSKTVKYAIRDNL